MVEFAMDRTRDLPVNKTRILATDIKIFCEQVARRLRSHGGEAIGIV